MENAAAFFASASQKKRHQTPAHYVEPSGTLRDYVAPPKKPKKDPRSPFGEDKRPPAPRVRKVGTQPPRKKTSPTTVLEQKYAFTTKKQRRRKQVWPDESAFDEEDDSDDSEPLQSENVKALLHAAQSRPPEVHMSDAESQEPESVAESQSESQEPESVAESQSVGTQTKKKKKKVKIVEPESAPEPAAEAPLYMSQENDVMVENNDADDEKAPGQFPHLTDYNEAYGFTTTRYVPKKEKHRRGYLALLKVMHNLNHVDLSKGVSVF